MRMAVLSDIHGNISALDRALEILEREGADELFVCGDVVGYGTSATRIALDRILAGKGHPFFCSQFVVYVYQFVAEQTEVGALLDAAPLPTTAASLAEWVADHPEAGRSPAMD